MVLAASGSLQILQYAFISKGPELLQSGKAGWHWMAWAWAAKDKRIRPGRAPSGWRFGNFWDLGSARVASVNRSFFASVDALSPDT